MQPNLELPGFIKDLKYLDLNDPKTDPKMWLRSHILTTSKEKRQSDNWFRFGIVAFILWALSSD